MIKNQAVNRTQTLDARLSLVDKAVGGCVSELGQNSAKEEGFRRKRLDESITVEAV